MSHFRTINRTTSVSRRIRPHLLRRDGVLQAPSEIPRSGGRYATALAAGWRPIA